MSMYKIEGREKILEARPIPNRRYLFLILCEKPAKYFYAIWANDLDEAIREIQFISGWRFEKFKLIKAYVNQYYRPEGGDGK